MTPRPVRDNNSSLKSLAKECLEEFYHLFDQSNTALLAGNLQALESMLNSIQQLAIDLGTMVENVNGEESVRTKAIVKCLEDLCETVYIGFNNASSNKEYESIATIKSSLDSLKAVMQDNLFRVKEILFLPIGPVEWSGFEPTYQSIISDPYCNVTVIPLPLLPKDYAGRIQATDEEIASASRINEYPSDLPLVSWKGYDLSLHHPESIYIQNTYDGKNPYLTVPPYYYTSNLRNCTDELVYIPIGKVSEFTEKDISDQACLSFYLTTPGIVYSDKIIVQSENIKTQYVNKLTGWAGENTHCY